MPSRFVLQPNGRLARFSTVVDHFTHYNLTKDEAIELAREHMGRQEAEDKVERGLKDEVYWHPGTHGDGTWRWKHDIAQVEDETPTPEPAGAHSVAKAHRRQVMIPPKGQRTRLSLTVKGRKETRWGERIVDISVVGGPVTEEQRATATINVHQDGRVTIRFENLTERVEVIAPDANGMYYCAKHAHEQTEPCPDCLKESARPV
jgi:hypothetical protein